ncbi:MAG: hypothetical protein ACHRXM_30380 [Isosphaerales bacterium]
MIRLRQWSALLLPAMLAPGLRAQDKPTSPWAIDRSLIVSPQSAPVPALLYRLLPLNSDLKEGNAVPIYLRLVHEQNDAARKYWTETPKPWNGMPVDRIPLDLAHKFLQDHRRFLRQFDLGARRRTAEWNYTLDEGNLIQILLPDTQQMRNYAPMLILQARVAIADGDFTRAAHHLETCFAISRHVGEGPFLINSLVAVALASQFAGTVADLVERPGAPNLYWALTALPRPFIDLGRARDLEFRFIETVFPFLGDLDRERTAEQWDGGLRRMRQEIRDLSMDGTPPKLPEWFPKDCAPDDPAAKSPDLAAAHKFVARAKGLPADKVEAMPPAQVLLLYMMGTCREDWDDWYRAANLPYPQARPLFEAAHNRLRDAPATEGHVVSRSLFSDLNKAMSREIALERSLAALRVIEALRIHAAAHDGKLPDKLTEVTEVPIPNDPGTDRPFEYSREGDTATLVSVVPGDPLHSNGLRYRVTIRNR